MSPWQTSRWLRDYNCPIYSVMLKTKSPEEKSTNYRGSNQIDLFEGHTLRGPSWHGAAHVTDNNWVLHIHLWHLKCHVGVQRCYQGGKWRGEGEVSELDSGARANGDFYPFGQIEVHLELRPFGGFRLLSEHLPLRFNRVPFQPNVLVTLTFVTLK